MENIFFGDSITAGSNSSYSFVSSFNDSLNCGISGTTIGEYSIYPVDGLSLLKRYNRIQALQTFNNVILEYGLNDVSAIMCGFTDLNKVIVSFVKVIDGIRQLTSSNIYFLSVSNNDDIINEYSKLQCEYLKNDYFKGYDFEFPVSLYAKLYKDFISAVSKRVEVIPMIDDINFFHENAECIGSDNLHPNEKGHFIIAETIKKYNPYI